MICPYPACARGGCPAGEYGWGQVDHDQIEGALRRAFECGVNFFDTADTYGLGRSESNIGQALRDVRNRVVIASKFGVRVENGHTFYDNSPAYIERALAREPETPEYGLYRSLSGALSGRRDPRR